jgi:LmbE family N-acetylglucosaminyl deacetylase
MQSGLTVLIAHPDDELLFLWPFLAEATRIVCVVSDINNPARQWCRRRKEALQEVGLHLGIPVVNFEADSEFYRLPTRDESLKNLARGLQQVLEGTVATHNPWGEYGHLDHILCHQIARASSHRVLTTGIAEEVNWLPIQPWQPGRLLSQPELDMDLFNHGKAIYQRRGCWTWSREPVRQCGVYECW